MPLISNLGDLERAVMDVLWAAGRPLSAREVSDQLPGRSLAYTTVATVLGRLAGKDFVVRTVQGQVGLFRAAASREQLTAEALQLTLTDLPQADRHTALVHFVDTATSEDLDALRAALARLEQQAP